MMPPIHTLLMPAVVVGGAGIVIHKFSWREYPALILWMCLAVFVQGLTYNRPYPAWMALVVAAPLCAWVREAVWCSRARCKKARWIALAIFMAAAGAMAAPALTLAQRAFLFRSYMLLEAFAVLASVTVYRLLNPVLECQRHKVYRIGATVWLGISALVGMFVNGGIGYRLMPYTRQRYAVIGAVGYWTMMATVAGMSAAMVASAPGRKRAAKRPNDGATVTGLIETERAA